MRNFRRSTNTPLDSSRRQRLCFRALDCEGKCNPGTVWRVFASLRKHSTNWVMQSSQGEFTDFTDQGVNQSQIRLPDFFHFWNCLTQEKKIMNLWGNFSNHTLCDPGGKSFPVFSTLEMIYYSLNKVS